MNDAGPAGRSGPAGELRPGGEPGAALARICQALGLELTDTQSDQLLAYLALLQRWNATYNLTSVRDPEAMLTVHLADCLAAAAALQRYATGRQVNRILDVGSGGGLPGVVLAVVRPDSAVVCADAVAKKAAFVRQVSGTLSLPNLGAEHGRVEALTLSGQAAPFDLITARAFASLKELVLLTQHLLAPNGVWMAMKGQTPEAEIAELPHTVEVFHVEQLKVPGLDAHRCLVWMRPRRDT